ncbi:hypothetical protein V495_01347 [Pseudogymnoascus sp. VKM F-4514 (FW-929)]|nr:hypothetical protein V495_01347 [Pseudogymnoascus sp. VKM F-4514 (FW-929)]
MARLAFVLLVITFLVVLYVDTLASNLPRCGQLSRTSPRSLGSSHRHRPSPSSLSTQYITFLHSLRGNGHQQVTCPERLILVGSVGTVGIVDTGYASRPAPTPDPIGFLSLPSLPYLIGWSRDSNPFARETGQTGQTETVPKSYLPYLYQQSTTLSLHTVNTRSKHRKIPFPPHKLSHHTPYYTPRHHTIPHIRKERDKYRPPWGKNSLIYSVQLSPAPQPPQPAQNLPLHLSLPATTHLANPAPVSLQPYDKPSPDTPFAFCLELSCSGPSPQPRKRKLVAEEGKDDSTPKRRSPDRPEEPSKRRQPESSNSSTCAGSLTEDMANIGGPAMLKRTLGLQNDRYSQYIGPTTDFEPSLLDLSHFDPQDESLLSRGTLRKVSDVDTFLMLPDYNTPGYEHVIEDSDAIEAIVTPHGPALIDLYFHVIHPSFPIIQKTVFLEKYARSYQEFSPALLAAMYILAINWWDHSEQLAKSPRPNVRELERLVRTSLADAMYRPKLSTIQAGLLLSQRPEGDQWAPTAQLVAIGQELGLHLDCSTWKIPLWERGLRKRLAWALYMQDKWGSLIHGRPSHIFASNWAVRSLTWNDFPDDQSEDDNNEREDGEVLEHERGRLLFTEMVSLSQLLAEVLETFYTLAAMDNVTRAGTSGTHMVLSLAKPVQLKLKEWFAALPVCLKMENSHTNLASSPSPHSSGSQGSKLSSTGFLHLSYFATEITLHRRIVRSLTPAGPNLPPIDPYILHICRSAAKTRLISAMDFVNRLTPSHLRAFWYFSSKTNFALIGTFGSLLWATAPGKEEADFYRMRLKEYRWTLGVSARAGMGADGEGRGVKGLTEFALGMLDTSTGLLKALPEKPVLSRDNSEIGLGSSHSASLISLGGMMSSSARSGGAGGYGFGFGMSDGQAGSGDVDSGLASPSDSTSSVEVSQGFEAFMAAHPQGRDIGGR